MAPSRQPTWRWGWGGVNSIPTGRGFEPRRPCKASLCFLTFSISFWPSGAGRAAVPTLHAGSSGVRLPNSACRCITGPPVLGASGTIMARLRSPLSGGSVSTTHPPGPPQPSGQVQCLHRGPTSRFVSTALTAAGGMFALGLRADSLSVPGSRRGGSTMSDSCAKPVSCVQSAM